MNKFRSLPLLAAFLVLPLGGCVTWQPVSVTPQELFAEQAPGQVRVTLSDGQQLILMSPVVRAGAIVATAAPGAALIEDITVLEVEQTSVIRSIGVMLPGVIILLLVSRALDRS